MAMPPSEGYYGESYSIAKNGFVLSYDGGTTFAKSNEVQVGRLVSFPVKKIWDGGQNYPEVTILLFAGDSEEPMVDQFLVLNQANNWEGVFSGLRGYTDEVPAQPISYRIVEERPTDPTNDPLKDYETIITGTVAPGDVQGFEVKNTYTVDPELPDTGFPTRE